ncbi:hypothetical protein WA158_000620 [Blastocystis sp. Blastoise]
MKSEWKYNTYDSLPTEWYGSSVDNSTWSTINGGTAIAPTDTNQYFVFRKTINTPSIANQEYFILRYKTLSNTKIYINNHELAVYGFIDGYLDSTDASTIIEQTATGPLSLFDNQETITISVLLFDRLHTSDISFDASLIMVVDISLPIYGNYEITTTNTLDTTGFGSVVDLDVDSYITIIGNSDNTNPILSIATKDGYNYINRYCIAYYDSIFLYAPKSWKVESIDINGNRHEHSVVEDAFNYYTPQRRCFLLSNVTTGINKLEFTLTNNMLNKVDNYYYISEIELFVDDITSDTVPLSTSSNPYIAYDNTTILVSFTNSDYYHDFTITPSLPDGLTLDTTTGSIYGIIHGENGNTDYTIHATSMVNTPYEYTFTIHIQSCQFPYNFVHIQLEYEQEVVYEVTLKTSTTNQEMINHNHILEESSEEYNICLFPSIYIIYVYVMKKGSHLASHVYVNNNYYGEFIPYSNFYLFFTQYADASKMSVAYSYDNITPPKHWTTNLFNDNLWSTVPSSSSLPDVPSDSITQYYRIHYPIEDLISDSNQFDITVSTYAGIIIYINGHEIRRINMNDDNNIKYNTLATAGYTEYKSFRSKISHYIDPSIRLIGDNIIAIEIHKYNNVIQPRNGLSIVINLINKNSVPITASWSVNGDVDPKYPLSNLYDGDYKTYTKVLNKCSNTIFTYTYNNETCVDVNQFLLYYKHDMSISYSPESIVIEATYNNGVQWNELYSIDGMMMNNYYSGDIYLDKCYNSYRVRITKCGTDPDISESESESMTILNELKYSSNTLLTCLRKNWSVSRHNKYSYKICPKGYTSNARVLCLNYRFTTLEGDSSCIKINPSKLYFEETNAIIKKNDFYEQYYSIDAVDTVITSTPSLPEGIMIDSVTQRIYGTPTSVSPRTTYTLSYTNDEGTIVDLSQISMIVIGLPCLADNNWPQTNPDSTISLSCPQYYEGNIYRLCSYKGEWEEANTNECIFSGSTPCTGTTYYNGNECEECINGIITSFKGNNIQCTLCNDNEFVYNNQCVDNDATCPAGTIDSYLYPETNILKNGIVNCTSENQYGYYKVYCDYISEPTWSNDIHKDRCYPRPVSIPGKALESLDYSMNLKTTIDDIYSLLVSLARTFVNTYSYQLTDLLLITDYITGDNATHTLLHAYYGSNRDFYSSSYSSKRQIFLNTITNYTNTPFNSSSVLLYNHTTLSNTNEYCQLPNQDVTIPLNYYYMISEEIENKKELYTTYFCKQEQLNYILIPARFTEIGINNLNLVLEFKDFPNIWIQPDIFISIYRSILISSKVPISQLRNTILVSNPEKLIVYYSLNIPNEVLIESATVSNYFNEEVLNNQLKKNIPFSYTSIEFVLSASN